MAITKSDVKLKQSERLTDADDGGGQMANTEVVDGVVNNLLPDISRFDRTAGRVNLRKAFAHIDTANVDTYYGAHGIVLENAEDPNVSVFLFDTESDFDERLAASSFLESYLVASVSTFMALFNTHLAGQAGFIVFAPVGEPIPDIGDVMALKIEEAGHVNEGYEQFLRITNITIDAQRKFTTGTGQNNINRTYNVLTFETSTALEVDFPGNDPLAATINFASLKTTVRQTNVAEIAKYYGIQPTRSITSAGANTVQLESLFGQIVPSTTTETPVIDQEPAGVTPRVITATDLSSVTYEVTYDLAGNPVTTHIGILPGSLEITADDGWVLQDDTRGLLEVKVTGTGNPFTGVVDYGSGVLTLDRVGAAGTPAYATTFTPAGEVSVASETFMIAIAESNRRLSYTQTLHPTPEPGTVTISFRSLGKWYLARDNGKGQLSGLIENTFSGQIDYETGSALLSLGFYPDIDSGVIFSWAPKGVVDAMPGADDIAPYVVVDVGEDIRPGTIHAEWGSGGSRSFDDNGAGLITGNAASGFVEYAEGKIYLNMLFDPPSNNAITIDYGHPQDDISHLETGLTLVDNGNEEYEIQLDATNTPIEIRTLNLKLPTHQNYSGRGARLTITDNGAGGLLASDGYGQGTTLVGGSIDYATGLVTIPKSLVRYVVHQVEIPDFDKPLTYGQVI